jgi:uncharacterized lipoprotein
MIFRFSMILLLAALLAGCGMFGTRSEYQRAAQVRPLEVPPELNLPSTQGTMIVPEVGGQRGAVDSRPGAARPAMAGDVLIIADEPASAWRRVSLALDRAGEITVIASDEAQRTIEVEVVSVVEPQGGWFTRTFRRSRIERDVYTLQVLGDGSERSRVQILDGAGRPASGEAARRISSVLRQRLG